MNKELLKKYFQNACSVEETAEVNRFLQQPGSAKLLQKLLEEDWAVFEPPAPDKVTLDNYRARFLAERETRFAHRKIRLLQPSRWLQYAAILLLAIGVVYYSFLHIYHPHSTATALLKSRNPNGQRSVITLADSTIVYLAAGSILEYPEDFEGDTREISLEGEAFFQVKEDQLHPFIIHTGSVQTQVLGTSFKIEAFKEQLLTVSVATGKVRVDAHAASPAGPLHALAVLTQGQQVSYDSSTGQVTQLPVAVNELQEWSTGGLVFNKKRMDEVAAVLERYYNVQIRITDRELNAYQVNTSFKANEPIDKVLQVLSATAGFTYTMQGKQITIKRR